MKAIFEDRTRQYTVQVGDVIAIDRMENVENDQELEFSNILLLTDDNNETQFGQPYVNNASIKAKVLNKYERDDKVIVFKFKRTKNYKRLKGHKQPYTIIKIEDIKA